MRKQLLFTLFLLFITFSAVCQDWQWAKEVGGAYHSESKSIAVDASGNSYVTGLFRTSISFGSTTLVGDNNGSAYVAKYDSNGNLVWAKQIAGSTIGADISVDSNGNPVVVGNFRGSVTIGAFTLASPDFRSAFIVKFDTNGEVVWARDVISSEGEVEGYNVAIDYNGDAIVTGNFFKSAKFGNVTITATKDEQVFIAKYSSTGDIAWVKMAGGFGSCITSDITTDKNGNLYLAGQFWLTAKFDETTLSNFSDVSKPADIFLAKYDANGNALWAKQAGGMDGNDVAAGITVDAEGNSYITGYYQTRATFGPTVITGNSVGNIFLAKYTTTGNLQWVKKQESSFEANGVTIDSDDNGNIYVGGNFKGSVAFGSTTLVSEGSYDIYFAKYDATGNVSGAIRAGGVGIDMVKKVQVTPSGEIYFTGDYSNPATFGLTTLTKGIVIGKLNNITFDSEKIPIIGTGELSSIALCQGANLQVPFNTIGHFGEDNFFTVQLSDENGSFATPVIVGQGFSSPVSIQIPNDIIIGTKYRLRVVSAYPEIEGIENGTDLRIEAPLEQPEPIIGSKAMCVASEEIYSVPAVIGATTYTWQVPSDWIIKSGQGTTTLTVLAGVKAGTVSVTASNQCHTSVKRELLVNPIVFKVTASATSSSIASGSSTFLSAKGADSYTWEPSVGLSNPNIANPVAMPTQTTTYIVTGFKDGCKETAQITVTVKEGVNPSNWVWANQGGNVNTFIETKDITTDSEGNVYVVGIFQGEASFGDIILNAAGYVKTFVVKYSAQGEVLWAKEGASVVSYVTGNSIITDSANNLYVVGEFNNYPTYKYEPSTVTFDDITLTAENEYADIYIIKYNKEGKIIWLKSAGGSSVDEVNGIGADKEGNIYITGNYWRKIDFDHITLENEIGGTYVAKYDGNGNPVWANHVGEDYHKGFLSRITVDDSGSSVVVGHLYDRDGMFLSKYDSAGNVEWFKLAQDKLGAVATDITLDKEGNVYMTGSLKGPLDLGEFSIESFDTSIMLAKFDPQGKAQWAVIEKDYEHGGTQARGVAVDRDGNILLTGSGNYVPENDAWYTWGTFLTKYNSLGHLIGSNVINTKGGNRRNGIDKNQGDAIVIDSEGHIYIAGSFKKEIAFGESMSLLTPGQEDWDQPDIFLAKARLVDAVPKPIITIGDTPPSFIPCDYMGGLSIPFTVKGRIHNNSVFNAYLLDKNGTSLGMIGSSSKSPILATIPSSVAPGEGYKLRVESTSPGGVSIEKEITLADFPVPTHITGETNTCIYGENEYSVPWQGNINEYTWTIPDGWYIVRRIYFHGIVVMPGMNSVEGYITVKMRTNCGQVYTRSLFVKPVKTEIFPTLKTETVCGTSKVKLTASGAPEGGIYNWYTYGGTTPVHTGEIYTPEVPEAKTFYVSIKINGCEGPRSVITTQAYPVPIVTAGPNETICSNIESYQLTGNSPEKYGYWSGPGVSPNGAFYPKSVGTGVYNLTYTYTYPFECAYTATKTITVSNCTGIQESKSASKLMLFPNPTKGNVTIELPLPTMTDVTLLLFDAKGQKLHEQKYTKTNGEFKHVLDLKNKSKGIYLLKLILNDGVITKRVVKD